MRFLIIALLFFSCATAEELRDAKRDAEVKRYIDKLKAEREQKQKEDQKGTYIEIPLPR